ncbi:MAG: hypothetical protein PHR35_04560 [Kiritimatiellae bacterium]|nr:hypothetical protein [Kiritimatiellia bacterium]
MNYRAPLLLALPALLFVSTACAQDAVGIFQEATPPAGVVKGFANSGNRDGVLVIGGRVVYPDETFTVTARGNKVIWKVIEVTKGKARFARAISGPANMLAPPPDATPNYGDFLNILKQGALAHKAASTSAQKEQIMASLRDAAKTWCAENELFCIRGIVTDLTMLNDRTTKLQFKIADGSQEVSWKDNLIFLGPFQINIPLSRDQALVHKAGHHVFLCGRPTFLTGPMPLYTSGITLQNPFASFQMFDGFSMIGSLYIANPRFAIYDPANESLQ